ncbi:hypothetical protein GF312_16265 [Candidatus Poribacteria bacterium]|nr:hypothetical protein [Candidatus Poribacteria bacterium]
MESIIRLNHRNNTQLQDIVNQINTIIGAKVIGIYPIANPANIDDCIGNGSRMHIWRRN